MRFSVPASSSISRLNVSFDSQLRIVLDDDQQPRQRASSARWPPASSARASARRPAWRATRRSGRRRPLLLRDALGGLHQVGNQVVAALQLVLDLRPLRLDGLLLADERLYEQPDAATAATTTSSSAPMPSRHVVFIACSLLRTCRLRSTAASPPADADRHAHQLAPPPPPPLRPPPKPPKPPPPPPTRRRRTRRSRRSRRRTGRRRCSSRSRARRPSGPTRAPRGAAAIARAR